MLRSFLDRLRQALKGSPAGDVGTRETIAASAENATEPPSCPYCGQALSTFPTRTRSCPSCRAKIVVRTVDKVKRLLTVEADSALDQSRKERAYRNKILDCLATASIKPSQFHARLNQLSAGSRVPWSDGDVAWRLFNEALLIHMSDNDFHAMAMTYHAMAWFRQLEGKNATPEVAERTRCELLDLQTRGYERVRIWTDCSCSACTIVKASQQTVEEALANPLLPVSGCESGKIILCHYYGRI